MKASEEQAHKSQMAKDLLARMNILEDHEKEDLPTLYYLPQIKLFLVFLKDLLIPLQKQT